MTLDNICPCWHIFRIRGKGNGVHPTIGEVVSDSVLDVKKAADLCDEGCHAGTTKAIPLLQRGGGLHRVELVWWREVIGGTRIETDPTRGLLPVQADHASLERYTILPIMSLSGLLTKHWQGRGQVASDAVTGSEATRCWYRYLGEDRKEKLESLERST